MDKPSGSSSQESTLIELRSLLQSAGFPSRLKAQQKVIDMTKQFKYTHSQIPPMVGRSCLFTPILTHRSRVCLSITHVRILKPVSKSASSLLTFCDRGKCSVCSQDYPSEPLFFWKKK